MKLNYFLKPIEECDEGIFVCLSFDKLREWCLFTHQHRQRHRNVAISTWSKFPLPHFLQWRHKRDLWQWIKERKKEERKEISLRELKAHAWEYIKGLRLSSVLSKHLWPSALRKASFIRWTDPLQRRSQSVNFDSFTFKHSWQTLPTTINGSFNFFHQQKISIHSHEP